MYLPLLLSKSVDPYQASLLEAPENTNIEFIYSINYFTSNSKPVIKPPLFMSPGFKPISSKTPYQPGISQILYSAACTEQQKYIFNLLC